MAVVKLENKRSEPKSKMPVLPAGNFSAWLRQARVALRNKKGIEVPCGACRACCTSSLFVHIQPTEKKTLALIPKKLLVPAPGLPKGHVLLGYYKNGHCPMFENNACSIYAHRPLTCRKYDCRIFTATGIVAKEQDKVMIAHHARRWTFSYPTLIDRQQHAAVKAAAKFIQKHIDCFPVGIVSSNPSRVALLAIQVYKVFLEILNGSGRVRTVFSINERVKAILKEKKKFEVRDKPV